MCLSCLAQNHPHPLILFCNISPPNPYWSYLFLLTYLSFVTFGYISCGIFSGKKWNAVFYLFFLLLLCLLWYWTRLVGIHCLLLPEYRTLSKWDHVSNAHCCSSIGLTLQVGRCLELRTTQGSEEAGPIWRRHNSLGR